jgi:signal transduction histidine kinase
MRQANATIWQIVGLIEQNGLKKLSTMMKDHKEKILVVDDAPDNLRMLMSLLSQAYEIVEAENGKAALTMAREQLPDLILLDVMMPDINGFEVCKQLKADDQTRHIPVIFLTVHDKLSDKMTAFKAGGVDYVTKPFHTQEVLMRVETHLTIHRLRTRLETQIAELDAFAHTVAHDLKSPLWLMTGFAEMLLADFGNVMPEGMREYVESIERTGKKGIRIVEEILLLASVERQDVKITAVDMQPVVTSALERLQMMLQEYGPTIIQPENWPSARGYAPWLEEVWVNYFSNALKYGGRPPLVECGATLLDGNRVKFWVQDNGVGIAPEDQRKLFAEFRKLETARNEGHGLGLSIVQRIIHQLGGEVGVESQIGQGSCFYFVLPGA